MDYDQIISDLIKQETEIKKTLDPVFINKKSLLRTANWFHDNDITISQLNGELVVINKSKKHNYISYLEKNTSFTLPPKSGHYFFTSDTLRVKYSGRVMDRNKTSSLAVVQYSSGQKEDVKFVRIGTENKIKITNGVDCIRVAIRLEANSILRISDVYVGREEEELDKKKSLIERYQSTKKTYDINVACILDEFSYFSFMNEVNLIHVTPENWKRVIDSNDIQFLFMESVWSGINGDWKFILGKDDRKRKAIENMTAYCKSLGIPSVFWSKEDPPHFSDFLCIAKLFEYVFTSDSNCIDRYVSELNHRRVFAMTFGVNIRFTNPIGKDKYGDLKDSFFAGTWYRTDSSKPGRERFEQREIDYNNIIYPALDYNLEIYSRWNKAEREKYNMQTPDDIDRYIVGSAPFDQMPDVYRSYRVMMNVNTVQNSPTMFSRRVIESMACGTPVISGPNQALENYFGDVVHFSHSPEQTQEHIERFIKDEEYYDRVSIRSMREVFSNHTTTHRMSHILKCIGVEEGFKLPKISIITSTNKEKYFDRIFANFRNQKYPNKELVLVINNDSIEIADIEKKVRSDENVNILKIQEEKSLGVCLNTAIECSNGDFVAKFDDDDFYSPDYLFDSYYSLLYSEADLTGKSLYFVYLQRDDKTVLYSMGKHCKEYEYTTYLVGGPTMVWKREVNEIVKFRDLNCGEDTNFQKDIIENDLKIFSNHKYGFLKWKSENIEDHTWKVCEDHHSNECKEELNGFDVKKAFILSNDSESFELAM